jgi:hypothetical protein
MNELSDVEWEEIVRRSHNRPLSATWRCDIDEVLAMRRFHTETAPPAEQRFTLEQIRRAGEQLGCPGTTEEIIAILAPPPKPLTLEERLKEILVRRWCLGNRPLDDGIAELVSALRESEGK